MSSTLPLAAYRRSLHGIAFFAFASILFSLFACSTPKDDDNQSSSSSDIIGQSSSSDIIGQSSSSDIIGQSSSSDIIEQSSSSDIVGQSSSSDVIEQSSSSGIENSLLLNYTGNYESGELRWMSINATSLATGAWAFDQDSKVASGGGNVFVLSRLPGVLTCILPENISNTPTMQVSLGEAQNPYDVTVIGNNGYIASNDADYVQVFNKNTCALGEKINLPITGASAATIDASGDTLLVVLQRLENWSSTKPGLLVRINATAKTVIDTIQLKFYNPQASVLGNGKLYVSSQRYDESFSIDLEKSGVEVVDLATGTTEVIATGTQLGGGAYAIELDEANQTLYVVVYESWGSLPVKPVNLANKTIGSNLPEITDASAGLVFDSVTKKLFVGDSHLKVYNTETQTTTAISEGANALPPYSLAVVRW